MGNELFMTLLEGVLLKYLGESEVYLAIYEVHIEPCGSHLACQKMK